MLARAARLTSRRARCSTPWPSRRCAPSCGCSRRWPTASWTASTAAWPRACCAPSATPSSFRHEIARVAVEEALPPDRRLALHRRALAALATARAARPRPPRPPRRGGRRRRGRAALRAGRRRARGHARVPPRGGRAVRPRAAPRRRACRPIAARELLERRSYECYLTHDIAEAHRGAPRGARRAPRAGRPPAARATRTAGSRAWPGSRATTRRPRPRRARRSSCSSRCAPGRELAMAYSNMAQLRMLASDQPGASAWGERAHRARRAPRRDRDPRPRAQQRGRGRAGARDPGGRRQARAQPRSWRSRPASRSTSPARTPTWAPARWRSRATRSAIAISRPGSRTAPSTTSTSWVAYMLGWRARSELDQGRWDAAAATASGVLAAPGHPAADAHHPAHGPRAACARAGAIPTRGGRSTRRSRSPRRRARCSALAPVAAARAEARWLAGRERGDRGRDRRARSPSSRPTAGPAASCTSGAGAPASSTSRRPTPSPSPSGSSWPATGAAAAELWTAIGCPYEAALALGHADDDDAQRRGSPSCSASARTPAARRVARALRERGARDVSRGPRAATRENPAGLTARELEVLALVAEGCATPRSPDGSSCPRRRSPTTSRPSCASSASPRAARPLPRPRRLGIVER